MQDSVNFMLELQLRSLNYNGPKFEIEIVHTKPLAQIIELKGRRPVILTNVMLQIIHRGVKAVNNMSEAL